MNNVVTFGSKTLIEYSGNRNDGHVLLVCHGMVKVEHGVMALDFRKAIFGNSKMQVHETSCQTHFIRLLLDKVISLGRWTVLILEVDRVLHDATIVPQRCVADDAMLGLDTGSVRKLHTDATCFTGGVVQQKLFHSAIDTKFSTMLFHSCHKGLNEGIHSAHGVIQHSTWLVQVGHHVGNRCSLRVGGIDTRQGKGQVVKPISKKWIFHIIQIHGIGKRSSQEETFASNGHYLEQVVKDREERFSPTSQCKWRNVRRYFSQSTFA
mmetsp:Transcript_43666/g.105320  ORF Transcript_43666/g.105320 Transcript_43666/m.105320 type:complete len:265 (+) Transcript_43666:1388-2182(+)